MEFFKELMERFSKPTVVVDAENGVVAVHKDYELKSEHLDRFREINEKPDIAREVHGMRISNKNDFIAYINEYKTTGTKIFYDDKQVHAVFNYTIKGNPDHGDSYCDMNMQKTTDFKFTMEAIGNQISQKDAVRLLKRLEPYITALDKTETADMDIVEMVEDLQAIKHINSVTRNAQQRFVLDVDVQSGKENKTLPRYISIEIPVYQNDLEVKADLDLELFVHAHGDGGFAIELVCYDIEKKVEDATRDLVEQILKGTKVSGFMR